jgi:1-aminocyclopropane-1-carboxylate deaminase
MENDVIFPIEIFVLSYNTTPEQIISDPVLDKAGIRLIVKREDLNHPLISGNKWWKLKYNLEAAKEHKAILTFGGAFSNHIYATAAAAKECGQKSVGIIRGEIIEPLNPTLQFVSGCGMTLHAVSREAYKLKTETPFIEELKTKFGDFYLIPEGGTNSLAVKGCAEFAINELQKIKCDYICMAVGTGGTIAGIISGLEGEKHILGIPVLKNGEFLEGEIADLIEDFSHQHYGNWSLLTSYHHGGYAKVTRSLMDFIAMMNIRHNLPLDPIYTGKLLWAVMKEAEKGTFTRGSSVLALHSGGLQGATVLQDKFRKI